MKNTVVVGTQWGDEGKGKITDLLAENADLIVRYQGGCNAGHTVVNNGKTYKFHLIPSGILYKNKQCFIGAGTVIYPDVLNKEIEELKKEGIDLTGLKISPLATITMPYHIDIDDDSEDTAKGAAKIGTTKINKGIIIALIITDLNPKTVITAIINPKNIDPVSPINILAG